MSGMARSNCTRAAFSVAPTLDTKLQVLARKTFTDGLVRFDEAQGWRGPVSKIDIAGDWASKLAEVKALSDVSPWRLAVVLEVSDQSARIGLQPGREPGGFVSKQRTIGILPLEGMKWAKTGGKAVAKVSQVVSPGDVAMSKRPNPKANSACIRCRTVGRHGGRRSVDRTRARHALAVSPSIRASSTGPRRRCASQARLRTVCVCGCARQWLHAVDDRLLMRRSKSTRGRASAFGGRKTLRQVLRACRHYALASNTRGTS